MLLNKTSMKKTVFRVITAKAIIKILAFYVCHKIEKNDFDFLIAAEKGFMTSLRLKNDIEIWKQVKSFLLFNPIAGKSMKNLTLYKKTR